jgi:transcriptional regulator with XRE-family HTH domain
MAEKEIKDIICYNRKRLGLTQEQLAEKLNVSNKTVSKWETGKSYPDVLLVPAITKELGISINQFFDCEDTKPEVIGKSNKEKLTKIRSNLILAFCFLLFAPIFVVVPTMLLQTIEVAMFCWVSGIVLWLASIILVIMGSSNMKYMNFAKDDKRLVVSIKNLIGGYLFVWQVIISLATLLLYPVFNEYRALIGLPIGFSLAFAFLMTVTISNCRITVKPNKKMIFFIVFIILFIVGCITTIINGVYPWCNVFILSQSICFAVLLTSNDLS